MTYRCPKHGTEWYTEKCGACEVAQQQAQVDRIASLETALASATVVRDAYHSRADAAESRVKHAEAERDACRAQCERMRTAVLVVLARMLSDAANAADVVTEMTIKGYVRKIQDTLDATGADGGKAE